VVSPFGGAIQIFVNNMEAAVLNSYLKVLGRDIEGRWTQELEEDKDEDGWGVVDDDKVGKIDSAAKELAVFKPLGTDGSPPKDTSKTDEHVSHGTESMA